jgi:sulfonate transport system ATP-binding protein
VLVLRHGRFVADVPIDLPRPRDRTDPASLAYRADFLAHLGVAAAPGGPPGEPTDHDRSTDGDDDG